MKTLSVLLLGQLLAVQILAADVTIQIGEAPLVIPTPQNFVPVTAEMTALTQLLENFVAPQNKRFVSFIPDEFLPAVQRGELPQIIRTVSVQGNKATLDRTFTKSDFAQLKEVIQKQNVDLIKKAEQQIPGLMDKINKKVEEQSAAKLDLSLAGMVPLPPHDESERSMSYSMLVSYKMTGPDGAPKNFSGVVTTTFMHAKGKLIFTYVNGGENDLEWSRKISKDWTTAILAANPSDAETAKKEAASSGGFNWNSVLRSAFIGGAIGAAIGLIGYLTRRKKAG
jgi:hypothetical protein